MGKLIDRFISGVKKKSSLLSITIVGLGLALSCMISQTALADSIVGGVMPTRGGNAYGLAYDFADGPSNRYGLFYRSIPAAPVEILGNQL